MLFLSAWSAGERKNCSARIPSRPFLATAFFLPRYSARNSVFLKQYSRKSIRSGTTVSAPSASRSSTSPLLAEGENFTRISPTIPTLGFSSSVTWIRSKVSTIWLQSFLKPLQEGYFFMRNVLHCQFSCS